MNISAIGRKRIRCGFIIITVILLLSIHLGWHSITIEKHIQVFISTLFRNTKWASTTENTTSVFSAEQALLRKQMWHLKPSRKPGNPRRKGSKKHPSVNKLTEKSEARLKIAESSPRKVLIISRGRSGSSFLGELFDKNPKSMYLFEPLGSGVNDDAKSLEILEQIYSCKTVNDAYLDFLLKNKSFRQKSSGLDVFSSVCKRPRDEKVCLARLIQSTCRRASSIVTKILTHRLPEGGVWGIVKLLKTNRNLRIIHLIRDPRRVINSMKAVKWFKDDKSGFAEQVQNVCDSVWNNTQYATTDAFFKGRYKLVVFREMIENPFTTAVNLYDFLKMGSVPNEVVLWIAKNTRGSLKTTGSKWDAYSTYRNSTAVLNKKVEFTERESVVVNKYCSKVINFLENY